MNLTFVPNRSITLVTSDFKVLTATKDCPNWKAIEAAVKANDEETLIELISMKKTVENFGKTGKIQIRNGNVFYRGEKLFGEDVSRIFSYLSNGYPHQSMVKFLEAKLRNAYPSSVEALYSFLENRGMPITDRGTILGYKGAESDFYSKNSGAEPLISGKRDERGKILNSIGETIWMDRRYVCDDNSQGCAGGLHIGSKNYATNWAGSGGHVMVVEFSPEHVVSVPTSEHEKLRVFKYKVVGEINDNNLLGDTYDSNYVRPDEDSEPDDEIVPKNLYNISDWSRGQSAGFADGKAHQKRKFYEEDAGRSYRKYSKEWIAGYLRGYKDGRN